MTTTRKRVADPSHILTYEDRARRYEKYIKSVQSLRFETGLGPIDAAIRGVAPGELMMIIAYSGTFKSALLQNLLQGQAKARNQYQMMFSLEMSAEKCFEREVQIGAGVCGWTVENAFKERSDRTSILYRSARDGGSDKVLVVDRPRLTLGHVTEYVAMAREKYGAVGAVGIDYLGLLDSQKGNLFERMAELSNGLKELAKELHIPIIALGQTSRTYAQSKGLEIETDAAKGGGDIEASCDFMLGMYMVEDELIMRLLKNRNGRVGDRYLIEIEKESLRFLSATLWTPPKKKEKGGLKDAPF